MFDGSVLAWIFILSLFLIVAYGIALGILALVRATSGASESAAAFWRRELVLTTWILALPGLIAAAVGSLLLIGMIPLAMGIWLIVVTHRVNAGRRTRFHLMPLVFVGVVDVLSLFLLVGDTYWDAGDALGMLAYAAYLTAATANAARIYARGRRNALALGPHATSAAAADARPAAPPATAAPMSPPLATVAPADVNGRWATPPTDDIAIVPPPPPLPPLPAEAEVSAEPGAKARSAQTKAGTPAKARSAQPSAKARSTQPRTPKPTSAKPKTERGNQQ